MWRSYCQPKHKVTRNLLKRKQMQLDSFNCVFCPSLVEERVEHLFWHCPFAQQWWGLLNLSTVQAEGTFQNILAIKNQLHSQFFMIAIILLCWTVWKARNEIIFNNNDFFFSESQIVSLRVKTGALFKLWSMDSKFVIDCCLSFIFLFSSLFLKPLCNCFVFT